MPITMNRINKTCPACSSLTMFNIDNQLLQCNCGYEKKLEEKQTIVADTMIENIKQDEQVELIQEAITKIEENNKEKMREEDFNSFENVIGTLKSAEEYEQAKKKLDELLDYDASNPAEEQTLHIDRKSLELQISEYENRTGIKKEVK